MYPMHLQQLGHISTNLTDPNVLLPTFNRSAKLYVWLGIQVC